MLSSRFSSSYDLKSFELVMLNTSRRQFLNFFKFQINIKLKSEIPVQIDGEPWLQGAGSVIVRPTLTQVLTIQYSHSQLLLLQWASCMIAVCAQISPPNLVCTNSLRPVHTRELAPGARSCNTLPEQSSLVCTNDF